MTDDTRIYLVIADSHVGRIVMAQSLFNQLKNIDPACRIDVLTRPELFPLLERMPQVADVIPLPEHFEDNGFGDFFRFVRKVAKNNYTHAIVLTDGWRYALLPVLARIPSRAGYAPKALLNDCRDANPEWTTLEEYFWLANEKNAEKSARVEFPELDISLHNKIQVTEKYSVNEAEDRIIGLCPGIENQSIQAWSWDRYRQLANLLAESGWWVWVFGEDKDYQLGEQICDSLGRCKNFAGQANFAEVIDLMSLTEGVLTNQSGLMHIALALRCNVLILRDSEPMDTLANQRSGVWEIPLASDPDDAFRIFQSW